MKCDIINAVSSIEVVFETKVKILLYDHDLIPFCTNVFQILFLSLLSPYT